MSEEKKPAQPQKKRSGVYTFLRVVAKVTFNTLGPVKYSGLENLPAQDEPFIIISNHSSFMDPVILASPVKKREITFMGKKELTSNKLAAAIFRNLHMIVVDRHNSDMAAMRACRKVLQDGGILGIFPEGTRHHRGVMEEQEQGAALIALRSGVPLIPVLIDPKFRLFRRTRCVIGKPVKLDDLKAQGVNMETCGLLMERIRLLYADMLKELRPEQ